MATEPAGGWKKAKQTEMDKTEAKIVQSIPADVKKPQTEDLYPIRPKSQRRLKLDPLTSELGSKGYMINARFAWLRTEYGGKNHALDVHRFYQEHKLLVDFNSSEDESIIKLKQKLSKENGFHYFHCKDQNGDDVRKMVEFCLQKAEGSERDIH